MFAALAAGGGDRSAVRHLAAAQRSKRLLLIRAVLDQAEAAGEEVHGPVFRGYQGLARLHGVSPAGAAAVEGILAYPSVGAWAASALRTLVRSGRLPPEPGFLESVAAAAAVRAGIPQTLTVPVVDGRVQLPSLGSAELSLGPAELGSAGLDRSRSALIRSGPRRTVITTARARVILPACAVNRGGTDWAPLPSLHSLAQGLRLAMVLDDTDRWIFPDRERVGKLGPADLGTWRRTFDSAWSLLVRRHSVAAREIAAALSVVVPLPTPTDGNLSATSLEAFGAIAISQPRGRHQLAATLVHEVQHAKLGALLDVVPLLEGPDPARWYAPWRDDPRPLSGLLQGAYAHLGVAGFWRQVRWSEPQTGTGAGAASSTHRQSCAHTEFARCCVGTADAIATLRSSDALTPAGRRFVTVMAETVQAWQREPLPQVAAVLARKAIREHRKTWLARYGRIAL